MKKIFLFLCLSLAFTACDSEFVPPTFHYKAEFDPTKVNAVETFVKEISKKWELRVFEKDRNSMKRLTQGYEAFYIALYLNDNAIFDITNVGVGTRLEMGLFDYGDIPVSELKKLGDEVRNGLKEQLQIEFEVVTKPR